MVRTEMTSVLHASALIQRVWRLGYNGQQPGSRAGFHWTWTWIFSGRGFLFFQDLLAAFAFKARVFVLIVLHVCAHVL